MMKTYIDCGNVISDGSGKHVPKDPRNLDYVRILEEVRTARAELVLPKVVPEPEEPPATACARKITAAIAEALSKGATLQELERMFQ